MRDSYSYRKNLNIVLYVQSHRNKSNAMGDSCIVSVYNPVLMSTRARIIFCTIIDYSFAAYKVIIFSLKVC